MKPPVLSDEEIGKMWEQWTMADCSSFEEAKLYATERLRRIAQAQRDADVEWCTELRNKDADQCSQATAREI